MKKPKKTLKLNKLVISKLIFSHTITGGSGGCVTLDENDMFNSEVTPDCKRPTTPHTCGLSINKDCI